MPRPLILLIAFSLFSATVYGADPPKPSPVVKRVLDEAVREVKKNRQQFDKANAKPLGDAKKKLQDEVTKLVESGKTDEAGVVLKQVGTLEADVMKMANAPEPLPGAGGGGGKVPPQKPLLERLEGKWEITSDDRHYCFYADGTAECVFDTDGRVQAKGRISSLGPDVAELVWSNGWRDVVRISADGLALAVFNHDPSGKRDGKGMAVERIK